MEDAMLSLSNDLRVEIQEESPSRYISSLFFLFFILSKFESMYETLHKRFYISFLHLRIWLFITCMIWISSKLSN